MFINKKNFENNQSLDSLESKIAENQNVFADGFPLQQWPVQRLPDPGLHDDSRRNRVRTQNISLLLLHSLQAGKKLYFQNNVSNQLTTKKK